MNDVQEQVKQTLDGEGAAPAAAETPKEESSPEVKTEEPKIEPKEESKEEPKVESKEEPNDAFKTKEQIDNLNAALREEREARRAEAEARKQKDAELDKANEVITKLQSVFKPEETPKEEETPDYMTKEEAEAFWQSKQEEATQASFKEKQAELIKSEIATLEKEWDGSDGKPKYSDDEVLKWQQENSKLYLTPVEAFNQMKKNEIVDWEVKQRLAGKKPVQNVEQPGVSPDVHTPADNLPKTDKELRDAITEAVNSADTEM